MQYVIVIAPMFFLLCSKKKKAYPIPLAAAGSRRSIYDIAIRGNYRHHRSEPPQQVEVKGLAPTNERDCD